MSWFCCSCGYVAELTPQVGGAIVAVIHLHPLRGLMAARALCAWRSSQILSPRARLRAHYRTQAHPPPLGEKHRSRHPRPPFRSAAASRTAGCERILVATRKDTSRATSFPGCRASSGRVAYRRHESAADAWKGDPTDGYTV